MLDSNYFEFDKLIRERKIIMNVLFLFISVATVLGGIFSILNSYTNYNNNINTCDQSILESTPVNNNNNKIKESYYYVTFTSDIISVLTLSFIILILITIKTSYSDKDNSFKQNFKKYIINLMPIIMTYIIYLYKLSLNINYKNIIINKNVTKDSAKVNIIMYIFIVIQLLTLRYYSIHYSIKDTFLAAVHGSIYLLTFLNILCLVYINIHFKFYHTDG